MRNKLIILILLSSVQSINADTQGFYHTHHHPAFQPVYLPTVKLPDFAGTFRRISEFKREQAERNQRQAYNNQMNALNLERQRQFIAMEKQQQILNALNIEAAQRRLDNTKD